MPNCCYQSFFVDCTRLFASKTARNNHQYMAHKNKNELSFKCIVCNIYFEMKEELRIHSFIHFNGEIKSCSECDQIFKTTRLLNVHMYKHQAQKSFSCHSCGDFFTYKTGLAKHMRLNRCKGPPDILSPLNRYSDSDQFFSSTTENVARNQLASITSQKKSTKTKKSSELRKPKSLKSNAGMKSESNEIQQESDPQAAMQVGSENILNETRRARKPGRPHLHYTCDLCGEQVKYMKGIKNHMKTHVSQGKLQCKMCFKGNFKSRKALSDHMISIHDIKTSVLIEKYTCDVCGGKFDTKSRFEGHKLSHDEKARTLVCSICSAAFKTVGNLHRHEATHAESKNFHCEKCSKSFKTKIALNVHNQNVHIEFNVLVECPICRALVKEKNLNCHTKKQLSEDSNLKPFICTICLKTFKTQKLGLRHYDAVHDPKDRGVVYSCPDCPEKFFRLRNLKDHSFVHSSGPFFQCEACKKMFKNARLLRIHEKTVHENAETTFACVHCNSMLKTRGGLIKHVNSRHPNMNQPTGTEKRKLNSE